MRACLPRSIVFAWLGCFAAHAERFALADPDVAASGISLGRELSVRIGDRLDTRWIQAGGLFEARNESRFNQGLLPNHNWRGFMYVHAVADFKTFTNLPFVLYAGFEHESAHPTMGIERPTTVSYEMIYDGTYRRFMLNSVPCGIVHAKNFGHWSFTVRFEYQFYLFSKNTPELPCLDLANSHGFSGSAEIARELGEHAGLFLSVFDRSIVQGRASAIDSVRFGQAASLVSRYGEYPIINDVNTLSITGGLAVKIEKIRRDMIVFGHCLYGNIFGFVDSRDVRTRFSAGIELLR